MADAPAPELWAVGARAAILPFAAAGAHLAPAEDPAEAAAALADLGGREAGGVVLVGQTLAREVGPALDALREGGRWLVLPVALGAAERGETLGEVRRLVARALGFDLLGREGG